MRYGSLWLGLVALSGCQYVPWDPAAHDTRVSACYQAATPDDVTTCLNREDVKDPVYPAAFKPGNGAFCSPDLDRKACREFLESANEPSLPSS